MHKHKKIFSNVTSQNNKFQTIKSTGNFSFEYNGYKVEINYTCKKANSEGFPPFAKNT